MGQIVAAYDLLPESMDVDLKKVMSALHTVVPDGVKIIETSIQPVAFGLMKINVGFIIDDTDEIIGTTLEDALKSLHGIENVECVSSTVL
jgi:elongation factor 1-beta